MHYLVGFVFVLALSVTSCIEETCARGCGPAGVTVAFEPGVASTYDVDLVLDGAGGAFTCEVSGSSSRGPTNQVGVGQVVVECFGGGFSIQATPASVEIAVNAQDDSWTGSVIASPDYQRVPRCPGESELCPPFAVVTVLGSIPTDCTGFADGTQCAIEGGTLGVCEGGVCEVTSQ